ncbi:MAG: beta/gamma crystallin-related protein [Pseudomonadota bacterium]
MTLALKTLALAATVCVTATLSATANGHRGDAKEAVLFKDPDFRGAAIAIDGPVYNLRPLGFNDTISSIDIRGAWEVCVDPDFRGRCVVIDGPTAHLSHLRMNDNISSMRPLRGGARRVGNRRDDRFDDHGRRGGGDFHAHNRGIEGRNTVFFPRPRDAFGDPIRGGRGNASDFCRDMGLGRAVYADTSRRNTTDILCAK